MASLANNNSITTTNIQVAWTVGMAHNFLMTNINDGPVRITVTPNNGLEFNEMHLGRAGASDANRHSLVGTSFTIEGDSGVFLRLAASAVDASAPNNTVTFSSENLHTGIRNTGSTLIALQADVDDAAIN